MRGHGFPVFSIKRLHGYFSDRAFIKVSQFDTEAIWVRTRNVE